MELCCTDDSMFVKVKVVVYTPDELVYSKCNCLRMIFQ
jgi:hypothetical protein